MNIVPLSSARLEADDTRDRLLAAAEEAFAAVGYEAATVRMICERAGVKNIGAVNYHFQGKERLYAEAVARCFEDCMSGASTPTWTAEDGPEKRLRDFVGMMTNRMMREPRVSAMRLMMREMTEPSAVSRQCVEIHIRPMSQMIQGFLGMLLPGVSEAKRWMIGFSIVGQCLFYRQNRKVAELLVGPEAYAAFDPETVADHIASFSLAAIRALAQSKE